MATNEDSMKELLEDIPLLEVGNDRRLKQYTTKGFLLKNQKLIFNALNKIGCCYVPSVIFQPAINLPDNDPSNLVDIEKLTKSLDKTLEGKYLLCRTISIPAEIKSDVFAIVDDPEGHLAVRLFIESFYPELLPVGTIIVIKNPLFELSEIYGYAVRCKSTGNITFLNPFQCHQFFPDVTWKGEIPEEHRAAVDLTSKPETADDWKVFGNKHFAERNYSSSINAYTSGLQLDAQNVSLLSNRSAAYLQISAFNLALNDANEVLNIDPHHVKGIYRKGKCLTGLKKYGEALEILFGMGSLDLHESDRKQVIKLKSKIEMFLHQQKTGDFDVAFMLKTSKADKLYHFDYADYAGPVEVRGSPGKGRGLFVTQDVKPGQLIVGSRALAMHPSGSVGLYRENIPGSKAVCNECMKTMELNIAKMLMTDPEIGKEFYNLYAGPELNFSAHDQLEDNTGFVDRNRIENICNMNTFGSQLDAKSASGVWLLPSYINHSCIDCNCHWMMLGDFMLIRAIKPIVKDDEVLISYIRHDQYSTRMEMLKKFGFLCNCRLCEMEQRDSKEVHEKRRCILKNVKIWIQVALILVSFSISLIRWHRLLRLNQN